MGKDIYGNDCGKGISQRADGRYYVRIKGIPPAYRDTLRDAQAYRDDQLYRQRNGLPLMSGGKRQAQPAEMTVDDFFHRWNTDDLECGSIRLSTYENRISYYNAGIKPVIGSKLLSAVMRDDCNAILKYINKAQNQYGRPYKNRSKRAIFGVLHGIFEAALDQELIQRSPVPRKQRFVDQTVEQRSQKNPPWKRALTNEELTKLFAQLKRSSYRLLIMLAWVTGMRIGELSALRYTDVDLDNGVIHVGRNIQYGKTIDKKSSWVIQPPKTDAGERDVPIWDDCRRVLEEIFALREFAPKPADPAFEGMIFLTKHGRPIPESNVYAALVKASDRAGIERVTMHTFRHTFITACRRAGMDALVIQRIVGHAAGSEVTSETYTHISVDDCRQELIKLNRELSKTPVLGQILSQSVGEAA